MVIWLYNIVCRKMHVFFAILYFFVPKTGQMKYKEHRSLTLNVIPSKNKKYLALINLREKVKIQQFFLTNSRVHYI